MPQMPSLQYDASGQVEQDVNKYYNIKYHYNMQVVILLFALLHAALSQPRCSASGIPAELPALAQEHLLLDMNRYFQGPNITLSLSETSPSITLYPKYNLQQQKHNLGEILSIASAAQTISMLGVSSTGRFYIYYAPISNPHNLTAKQLPTQLIHCTNHAHSPDGQAVVVTCQHTNEAKLAIAYTKLNGSAPWSIEYNAKFASSSSRQVEFMSNDHCAVVVFNPYNSYIELWDVKNGRVIGIYDRTFLSLVLLNIMDVQMTGGSLFILDYETGVYELKLVYDGLKVVKQLQFTYYSKMAVNIDSLVITKKGSVTEFGGKNVFKYESVGTQTIKQLIISPEYIIVYTDQQVIVYLRGYHAPYFTFGSVNHHVSGVFTNATRVIQAISAYKTTQITLQQIILAHPYLRIPSNTPNNTKVQIRAVSQIYSLEQHCNISFVLLRTHEEDMEIFQSVYSKHGTEHIFMNRPGRAEIDLTPYGMGPDLNYQIQTFSQTINLTADIRKIRKIQTTIIQGFDKMVAKTTYFSQACGLYRNQCPLAVDTITPNMINFFSCKIEMDFYDQTHKINCSEKYRQFKMGEYLHYDIAQPSSESMYFYEISVLDIQPDVVRLRKFQISAVYYKVVSQSKTKINGTNKYNENNISQLQLDEDNKMLYILLRNRKEIQVFRVSQGGQDINMSLYYTINAQVMGGIYFAPRNFELDSDGMFWIKSYDQIFVLDLREIDYRMRPKILSVIVINQKYIRTYDYDFQIIQETTSSRVFNPATGEIIADSAKQQNRKYLVIYDVGDVLLMCTVSSLYEIDENQLQPLPRYGYHVPNNKNQRVMQSLGNSMVFVALFDPFNNVTINMIYNLKCLSLVQAFYSQIQTKNTSMPAYFHLSSNDPIIVFIQPNVKSSQAISYQISKIPKMVLTVTDMPGQSKAQQMIIQVYNKKDRMKYSVLLGISNSQQNLTKGQKYPYPIVRKNAVDKYIQVDTVGWIEGNVLSISYACKDCRQPNGDPQLVYIDVKGKLWLKQNLDLAGGHEFEVVTTRGQTSLVGIIRSNAVYVFDVLTHRIIGLYQLTQSPTDEILKFQISDEYKMVVALVRSQTTQISIVTFSIANDKGFPLARMVMPSSVQYIINMQFELDVAIVLDFFNVYIISIDNYGNSYIVDYINEVEAGGIVCWAELIGPRANLSEYKLIITLCQTGITYISFILEQNLSVLKITNKQTLDFKANLNSVNIRMPTDATFRRTKTIPSEDGTKMAMYMVISNFDSIQWTLTLKNKITVSEVRVTKIIHRYEDYGATQDINVDKQNRFMIITYYGFYQTKYQYINAIYDLQDLFKGSNEENYLNCYIMESFPSQLNKRPQFISNHTLMALSDDAHHLKRIDVDNKFRAVIHNEDRLYSQSIFMIPYTPVSSISVEIIIKGINLVVWELWEIMLIALFIIIIVALSVFLFKVCLARYQENQKLVPLLKDYAEYEEDLAEEIEERRRGSKGSLITDHVNMSQRGSATI